jgi:quercetin dioxygenase-like cupin family protein
MRTKIAQDTSLRYERAKAVLDFKTAVPAPGISPFQVAFRFEAGAEFDSFAHFHADHDEFLYVEQGEVMLELNGVSIRVSPADGELRIPRWTPHRWYLPSGAAETGTCTQSQELC